MEPKRDAQTVTPDSKPLKTLIHGAQLRYATTHVHEHGSLTEIFNPAWGFHPDPLVFLYQFSISPGRIRGWVVHYEQEDRIFVSLGKVKVVLYDDRPSSPTYKQINEIFLSEHNRALLTYPAHVYHAIQNIGDKEALLINLPNKPYNHASPDKYRLPLNNDKISYQFTTGWIGNA
jgi:dTDP-4-dehydrorhamnose 3,5-epimerase